MSKRFLVLNSAQTSRFCAEFSTNFTNGWNPLQTSEIARNELKWKRSSRSSRWHAKHYDSFKEARDRRQDKSVWKAAQKTWTPKNGRNVFGSLAGRRTWRGHSRILGLEMKTNIMGQASWADRNWRGIIALFLAIRHWSLSKNSNEITRVPKEYLFSQIRWSVLGLI